MKGNRVRLLGERDFLPYMETEGKEWRRKTIKKVRFQSFDKTVLQSYYAVPEDAKAAVVLVHGFTEFFGKYYELCQVLYEAGFAVFFLEQRGHGLSEGKLPNPEIVHINSYRTYVKDLNCFVETIVKIRTELPLLLLAHSMGGAVSALYLEKYKDVFQGAALCSPMLHIKNDRLCFFDIARLQLRAWFFREGKNPGPGQHGYNSEPDFHLSNQGSRPRFQYVAELRRRGRCYQTAGGSLQWGIASVVADRVLMRFAGRIETPIVLFEAGEDALVSMDGYKAFARRLKKTPSEYFYEGARHELYNARRFERKCFYRDLLRVLPSFIS